MLDEALNEGIGMLRANGDAFARLVGVGIGVPGPVDQSRGCVTNPPIMPGWDGFDIPAYVGQQLDVLVLVDNDVNILALGEHALTWTDAQDLVYVKVATGIGAGIIAGGELQRGDQGSAGDIGHLPVPEFPGGPRFEADGRDLEGIASGPAIARALQAQGLDVQGSADVVRLVRQGNAEAVAAVRQAGRAVGAVIALMVNVLNPSVVVLGGSIAYAGQHLLAGVREVVYSRSLPLATARLEIVQTRGGESAGVLGAAILVAQRVLAADQIETFGLGLGSSATTPPHATSA